MTMPTAVLPANAIVTFESPKNMPPVALAVSAAVLAYLGAGVLAPSSHVDSPAIIKAPSVVSEPTPVAKHLAQKRDHVRATVRSAPKTIHMLTRAQLRELTMRMPPRANYNMDPCQVTPAAAARAPETEAFPNLIVGRMGNPTPLTQSHIFENVFRALFGRRG